MARRKRIDASTVKAAIEVYRTIPIRFVEIDLDSSLEIALEHGLLDRSLRRAATEWE